MKRVISFAYRFIALLVVTAYLEALHASVGATLVDYYLTRGQYDFCVISEADSFSVIAAMTLKPRASGAVENLVTLEAVDIEEIQETFRALARPSDQVQMIVKF